MYKPASRRYRKINGKETIEIRVNDALQLFDSRDPAPFRDRDLDDDFTDYVIASADEIPFRTPVRIQIYIAKSSSDLRAEPIIEAIQSYLEYQVDLKRNQFAKIMRMAQSFLLVGLAILSACLMLSRWVKTFESELFGSALGEGIVIFGWVSMWKPLELLLFDWYPIYDRIRLLRKLLKSEIRVDFENQN